MNNIENKVTAKKLLDDLTTLFKDTGVYFVQIGKTTYQKIKSIGKKDKDEPREDSEKTKIRRTQAPEKSDYCAPTPIYSADGAPIIFPSNR